MIWFGEEGLHIRTPLKVGLIGKIKTLDKNLTNIQDGRSSIKEIE
jgi:hypothetical protein